MYVGLWEGRGSAEMEGSEGWSDEEWKLKRDERKERELVAESGSVQEVIRGLKDVSLRCL